MSQSSEVVQETVTGRAARSGGRGLRLPRFAVAAAVAVACGAVGWLIATSGSPAADLGAATVATASAAVERRTLVVHENVDGTLGYGDSRTLLSGAAGTVTRLPEEGSVVKRGQALYEIDGRPATVLLYGSQPGWRALREGVGDGRDVRQLEENLRALNLAPPGLRVDGHFDFATRVGVERLQERLGLPVTGVLAPGVVTYLEGRRRIGEHKTRVGDRLAADGEVLVTTQARQTATVALDTDLQRYLRRGDRVSVLLPDGSTAPGQVVSVGAVARTDEQGETTVELELALGSGAQSLRLDKAAVSVSIATDVARDALVVPVTALLAQPDGSYAVEVVAAGGARALVPVKPGLYGDGVVAVEASGLRAGMRVVVPA